MGRSAMFQPHSQEATSGTCAPSSANARAPSTTRGSSRRTPSLSLNSTRCRIMDPSLLPPLRAASVGEVVHELPEALRGVRYPLEAYLHQVSGPGGLIDDRVEHEDHQYVHGDLPCLCHAPLSSPTATQHRSRVCNR